MSNTGAAFPGAAPSVDFKLEELEALLGDNPPPFDAPLDLTKYLSILNVPAACGELSHPWPLTRALIAAEFYSQLLQMMSQDGGDIPDDEDETWKTRARRVAVSIRRWEHPPFTLQRLGEILLSQRAPASAKLFSYATASKFLLAVSKSVCGITARPHAGSALALASSEADIATGNVDAEALGLPPLLIETEGYNGYMDVLGSGSDFVFFDPEGTPVHVTSGPADEAEAERSAFALSQSSLTLSNPEFYGPSPGQQTPRASTRMVRHPLGGFVPTDDDDSDYSSSGDVMGDADGDGEYAFNPPMQLGHNSFQMQQQQQQQFQQPQYTQQRQELHFFQQQQRQAYGGAMTDDDDI